MRDLVLFVGMMIGMLVTLIGDAILDSFAPYDKKSYEQGYKDCLNNKGTIETVITKDTIIAKDTTITK